MKRDIYIFNSGELKRKDNTLFFESKEGKKYIPVEETAGIWVFSDVTLNNTFLEFASEKEICVHFFNYYGYYTGTYYPREHLNSGFVILKQAEYYLGFNKRLNIAQSIIESAVSNMLVVLRYYKNRVDGLDQGIKTIEDKYSSIADTNNIEELMACEGNIREEYYKNFNHIIKNPDFRFYSRSRRPPLDRINALISFGNSVFYTTVLSEIYQTQLDPRIGYLHSTNTRSFTLNLDVSEIFKPLIVDRAIFTLLNRSIITKDDFSKVFNGIMMNENGRKKFMQEYNNKLGTTINNSELKNPVSYKRIIRMELYKLQKHITEGKEYHGFVARW